MYADYFLVKNIFLACVEPKLLSQTFKGSSGEITSFVKMGAAKNRTSVFAYCAHNTLLILSIQKNSKSLVFEDYFLLKKHFSSFFKT